MSDRSQVLSVRGLGVSYPSRQVLHDVNFDIGQGEFCGLIGANGSGKTTLFRTLLGLQTLSEGRILLNGGQVQQGLAAAGYVPQKNFLDPDIPLTARDVVALGLDGHRPGFSLRPRRHRQIIDEMLAATDALCFASQRIGRLSGGQQQRVLIAHALARRPRLLLLDEPLANLDMAAAADIISLLKRLAREQQVSVLLSAHDINPLLPVMDRVVYLANGRAASGPAGEVIRTSVLSRLYGYHIDVIRVHGRMLVVATDPATALAVPADDQLPHVTSVP